MLLQRRINKGPLLAVMLAMVVAGGCAGTAAIRPSGEQQMAETGVGTPEGEGLVAVPPRVLTLFEQASSSMAAGDLIEAELRFKEFLLQYPQYPGAHVNLAIIHSSNGDDTAARDAVQAALALDANHPAALNQLGMLLRRNGNFLEAEAAYLKAVTVSPEYALAHYNLGVLNELYLQRLQAALQHFKNYQSLAGEDKQVAKWIKDLTRRIAASQRTANRAQ